MFHIALTAEGLIMASYITNAFSLNMLSDIENGLEYTIKTTTKRLDQAKIYAVGMMSAVGHADTANLFSNILGIEVPVNRGTLQLKPGDWLLVGQYKGPRLPEGCVKLPEGASVAWIIVGIARAEY